MHPHVRSELLPTLGTALSHSYLVSGFLPTRIVFPAIVAILKGPHVQIPTAILRSCFVDYVSIVDAPLLNEAMKPQQPFDTKLKTCLVNLFSRFDCREVPTPSNILLLIDQVSQYEFVTKPMAPIVMMNQGIPAEERRFWQSMSVCMLTTPSKLLQMIEEPFFNSPSEECVFGYLQQFVGNMSMDNAQRFLRFVTGSSVAVCRQITVEFNALSGLARCPIVNTCTPVFELLTSYHTCGVC